MNYQYINHDEVAALIKSGAVPGKDYQVVDVRDEDFRGGNIPGAINAPSEARTEQTVMDLVTKLDQVPKVIFHCTLSQVRGPKNARIYADAVAARTEQSSASPSTSTTTTESSTPASSDQSFSPNPYSNQAGKQQVYVLKDGFGNWQGLYRNDPQLVENFDSKIWHDFSS
ncbi:uncharacterized protein JCM6883_001345 [Sporobolomyces salmoneus]|uniref:uncharacterized protein n=1 Tax=Sporobolomyces salmoneus TaxID=183962 RepID=UPI00317C87C1